MAQGEAFALAAGLAMQAGDDGIGRMRCSFAAFRVPGFLGRSPGWLARSTVSAVPWWSACRFLPELPFRAIGLSCLRHAPA